MTEKRAKAAKMTDADLAAGRALRTLWDGRAGALGLTQEAAGAALGINQSATSQYLNSKIPIGLEACIKWAALLRCDPAEIRPEFTTLFDAVVATRAGTAATVPPRANQARESPLVDVAQLRSSIAEAMRELARRRIVPQDSLLAAAAAFLYSEYARRGRAAEAAKDAIDEALRSATTRTDADELA